MNTDNKKDQQPCTIADVRQRFLNFSSFRPFKSLSYEIHSSVVGDIDSIQLKSIGHQLKQSYIDQFQ